MTKYFSLGLAAFLMLMGQRATAAAFNGVSDNGTDAHGYYYAVSGGLFPTGNTPNGDNASGGTFRFVADNAAEWGRDSAESQNWQKDSWYPKNGSIGLTLKNGSGIVYDNNGLEDGSFPTNYYTYNQGTFPTEGAGAVTAYSMSNNFDWIYAGYFKLEHDTTVSSLTGYFVTSNNPNDPLTGGFKPNDPVIGYRMNIWSNVTGDLLPTNTGSFNGDVFTSDTTPGTFSWSDTGYDRTGSSSVQDIYRLTYTLDSPLTLAAGTYWFSHDAIITPEPVSVAVWSLVLVSLGVISYWHRRNATSKDASTIN